MPIDEIRPRARSPRAADPLRQERLRAATADVVAERGYRSTTLRDIAGRAGVSVGSARQDIGTADDCFIAAFDSFTRHLSARLVSAYRKFPLDCTENSLALRSAIDALMHIVATTPGTSWLYVVEARGASRPIVERAEWSFSYFSRLLGTAVDPTLQSEAISTEIAHLLVGGIWRVVYLHMINENLAELPMAADSLVSWIDTCTKHPLPHRLGRGDGASRDAMPMRPPYATESAERDNVPHTRAELGGRPGPAREHLLRSTATVVQAHGYHVVTVTDITERLGIARSTFYRYFHSIEHAVLVACDEWFDHALSYSSDSYRLADSPARGIHDAIACLVKLIGDAPDAARLALVHLNALGTVGRARHERVIAHIAELWMLAFGLPSTDDLVLQATVGAIWNGLRSFALELDDTRESDPTPDLAFMALTPFVGASAAASVVLVPS